MYIALATYEKLPAGDPDDEPLDDALAARGARIAHAVWDDARVDWSVFDAVLVRSTWDYQRKHDAFVAWAGGVARVTRLFNPADVIRWNSHKSYLRDLEERGAPVVPTEWLKVGMKVSVAAMCRERRWTVAFIKPAVGASSHQTMRFDADDPRAQRHADELLRHGDLLLQPYLGDVERRGEASAVFIDGELTHAVRKIPASGDYRVQEEYGARDEAIEFPDPGLARRVVAMAGVSLLYARADFLTDEGGRLLLSELELVEPSLFLRRCPQAAARLAEALLRRVAD